VINSEKTNDRYSSNGNVTDLNQEENAEQKGNDEDKNRAQAGRV
jgi:hypothetical protein